MTGSLEDHFNADGPDCTDETIVRIPGPPQLRRVGHIGYQGDKCAPQATLFFNPGFNPGCNPDPDEEKYHADHVVYVRPRRLDRTR